MARKYFNLESGTLGAALTDVETTITFAAAPGFATLSGGDVIALTLGGVEIVHLTAYTAGATTGTILRGQEGTTAVAHSSGDEWEHAPTVEDFRLLNPGAAGVRVRKTSGDQAIAATTVTKLTFNNVPTDTHGFWNSTNNRFVVPAGLDGMYLVLATCLWYGGGAGYRDMRIHKNGSTAVRHRRIPGSDFYSANGFVLLNLAAGDYVEVLVEANSAGTVYGTGGDWTQFEMFKVSDSGNQQSFVGARIEPAAPIVIPNNTSDPVDMSSVVFDTHGFSDGAGFTIPDGQSGTYLIGMGVRWSLGGIPRQAFSIKADADRGATYDGEGDLGAPPRKMISNVVELVAGDTLTMSAYQNSGSSKSVDTVDSGSFAFLIKLGQANHSHAAEADTDWHVVGDPGEPAYENGWVAYETTGRKLRFRKTAEGVVILDGATKDGTAGTVMFTLPAGYRPYNGGTNPLYMAAGGSNTSNQATVKPTGEVGQYQGNTAFFSLSGVMFFAEQ